MNQPVIYHGREDYLDSPDGLLIKHSQEIPQEWLDHLKAEKAASTTRPAGNYHRFASIPRKVYEMWLAEGYDAVNEPAAKTIAKLQAAGLDSFITTGKRL
jgi:hypothetical protein